MRTNFVLLRLQGAANPFMSMANGGGKGDSPPPPDYTPMAQASTEAAQIAADVREQELAENRRQYDQNMAVAQPVIKLQTELMEQSKAQGDDYYNYNKETFRPIEQELADEAKSGTSRYETNAGVKAAVEREASRAAADVARASSNADAQSNRAMAAMGVNPNSGRFASMNVGKGLALAASKAAAQTGAREKGVAMDYAKRLDVTGLGRGLPGASQGAYGVALNAGNSAVGNQNGTGAGYMSGIHAANQTLMQGQGLKIQGLGGILNSQTSMYNAGMAASGQESAGMGAAVGGIAMAAATAF
jgi:hypothetical protein